MTRVWWIVVIVVVILVSYFVFDYARDAYKVIPIDTAETPEPAPFADWYPYTSAKGGFMVEFPLPPQNAMEQAAIPKSDQKRKYDMYVSEQLDGTIYMVNVITYPPEVASSIKENMLQMNLQEMVESNPNNVLESQESTTFLGNKGIQFVIVNTDLQIKGVLFQKGDQLYILSTVGKKKDFDEKAFSHFLETFRLTPSEISNNKDLS